MTNIIRKLFHLLLLMICLTLPTTCKKLEKSMLVTTGSMTSITTNSAEASGEIIDLGEGATQHGHCYATNPNVTISGTKTQLGKPAGIGGFTSQLNGLEAGTKYYVKAYISDGTETAYGKEINFTTISASLPTLSTTVATSITETSAISGGNITSDGGASVTARGVCWSTSTSPTTADSKTTDGIGTGSFVSSLTGLTSSTTYYVRAYATSSAGTAYGNQMSFITNAASIVVPTLSTTAISSITETSAISGGNITSDGGATITARGVCWSTSTNPTTTDNKTTNGTGAGSFASNLAGLTASTTYYVRAYATNSAGTAYGNQLDFTTNSASPVVPTLTTAAITSITETGAVSGGEITSDGGASVTERGVCWSTSADPTTTDSKTTNGTGAGSFASNLAGLTAGTTYYVRAYATNSAGTAYGNEVNFTTSAGAAVIPTLTTTAISSITTTTASSGGNITSDGGALIIARGVCWNTAANPVATDSHTDDGTTPGTFTSSISGLNPNTTYYARAYATNSIGTAYGDEYIIKTATGTVTDIEGNVYYTVTVGTQVWMAENLKTTQFRNGSDIPLVTNAATWASISTPGYCWYENDESTYKNTYGALYNWHVVNSGYLCPAGWHIPDDSEWDILTVYLAGEDFAGGKLKEAGTAHWNSPNTGATNESGFTALPGGVRYGDGTFNSVGDYGNWWTLTGYSSTDSWARDMGYNFNYIGKEHAGKGVGFSVRCVEGTVTNKPAVSTNPVSVIASTSATVGGNVTSDGGDAVTDRGVYYSTSVNAETTGTKLQIGAGTGTFSTNLEGLSPETIYYIKAYATNSVGTSYGIELSFSTSQAAIVVPTLSTTAISSVTGFSAASGGNITSDGGSPVTERGVCWSTSSNPTIALTTKTSDGAGTGTFISNISSLSNNITYYVRAYATNSIGTAYGEELSFTTLDYPIITTTFASSVTTNSAVTGGNITSDGGSEVTARGVCWSTAPNPAVEFSQKTEDGTGPGVFVSNLTSLAPGTLYHIRAYATNSVGTSYGDDMTFETLCTVASATTNVATNITDVAATLNGTVNANNFSTEVTFEYGFTVAYGGEIIASQSPVSGTLNTPVSAGIASLASNTTYHCRLKTVNCGGTIFGEDMPFTTLCTSPSAQVSAATSVGSTSVVLNGAVNANGSPCTTSVSFEYGTTTLYGSSIVATPSPVTGASATNVSASLSGLNPGTTYYYRIKAVNNGGTTFSPGLTFITPCPAPAATTTDPSNIGSTSATLAGSVVANGCNTTVTFEYGLTTSYGSTYTVSNPVTGYASTNVTGNVTGLLPGNTYHYRIKASNDGGTNYGLDMQFKTTVTDIDGNIYHWVTISGSYGTQIWLTENLKTTRLNTGEEIQMITPEYPWSEWFDYISMAYCWYYNDIATKDPYGALYNWYAVNSGNLCPTGWSVPSDAAWTILLNNLGGGSVAGGKLKEAGFEHWADPNTGATNESGFTAVPGGEIRDLGMIKGFIGLGLFDLWWARDLSSGLGIMWGVNSSSTDFNRQTSELTNGFSVRCLKD